CGPRTALADSKGSVHPERRRLRRVVDAAERHEHDVRSLLHARLAAVAQVPLRYEDADNFAGRRLVAGHRAPARVVVPVDADFVGAASGLELAAIPELNRSRAIPLPTEVEAHAERVLNAARAESRLRPLVRTLPLVEVDDDELRHVDGRDLRRFRPR